VIRLGKLGESAKTTAARQAIPGASVLAALALLTSVLRAQDGELLQNPGFEQGARAWEKQTGYLATVKIGKLPETHGGAQAARLTAKSAGRAVTVRQRASDLPAGVYEFSVWCKGEGKLQLAVKGVASRRFAIAAGQWRHYSLAFEVAEPRPCVLLITVPLGDAAVDDASLGPAEPALAEAWRRQQEALAQFHFIPSGYSAQRPAPAAAATPAAAPVQVAPITDRTVFYDPRYDTAWNTRPEEIAAWFEQRGFTVRNAEDLAAWMAGRIAAGAYGSVVVMGMGLAPASVVTPLDETCLLRRYMDAGGRVVWTGDTALYVVQDPTGPSRSVGEAGMGKVLGMTCDWGMWRGKAQFTDVGKRWGLASPGSAVRAARREEVTLCMSGDPKEGNAAIWLKTTNPRYPLSGFITSVGVLDGRNQGALQDFYRLALFTGEPVTIPKVETGAAPAKLALELQTMARDVPRRALVRGETAEVAVALTAAPGVSGEARVTVVLTPDAPRLRTYVMARKGIAAAQETLAAYRRRTGLPSLYSAAAKAELHPGRAVTVALARLPTADLAVGDYELRAETAHPALAGPVVTAAPFAVCPEPRRDRVQFVMRGRVPENAYRRFGHLDRLKAMGEDLQIGVTVDAGLFDALLRNDQAFLAGYNSPNLLTELRKGAQGEDYPNPWGGGRAGLKGVAGQACRDNALRTCAEVARRLAPYPAFSRVFLVNDDFSARGGWDYNPENVKEFKAKTGLDAPIPAEFLAGKLPARVSRIKRPPGVVPDDDPWLLWNEFLCRDVLGGFNNAEQAGFEAGCPGAIVWSVPGGAQFPLFMPQSGQYPPLNFGRDFGLKGAGFYAYLSYWGPSLQYLYWSEVARMGARDAPVWCMPDAGGDARHYIRNQGHILLAAGVRGIAYFVYAWTKEQGRREHADLGALLERFGPLLHRLRPAPKAAGMLLPFSDAVSSTGKPVGSWANVFVNLLLAHVDVEPVAEEELAAAAYRLILLSDVQHLRASTVSTLEKFAAAGGTVLCDSACKVEFEGARELPIRFGTGSIWEYAKPERLEPVRQALAEHGALAYDSPQPTTVVRPFVSGDGVRYLYAVQVDTNEEYCFYRKNVYEPNTFKKQLQATPEELDAFLREHGMMHYLQDGEITVAFPAGDLPEGGVVVDVYRGQVLTSVPHGGGKLAVTAPVRRFGGVLLALLPSAVQGVEVVAQPAPEGARPQAVRRGDRLAITASVLGRAGAVMPGSHPLHVELKDPDGNVRRELTGHYASQAGRITLSFVPARNHPPGAWRLTVTELLAGRSGALRFEVR